MEIVWLRLIGIFLFFIFCFQEQKILKKMHMDTKTNKIFEWLYTKYIIFFMKKIHDSTSM